MLKRAREKKSTTFLKKSDYEFGRFSSAQIASAIFVRELLRFAMSLSLRKALAIIGGDDEGLFCLE